MSDDIDQVAALWHFAQAGDDMDWQGFTLWLEADPRHRASYDAIALLDDRIDRNRTALQSLLTPQSASFARSNAGRYGWPVAAAASVAALALGITLFPLTGPVPGTTSYHASSRQIRTVQLADGSTATLAPGTVLTVATSRDAAMTMEGNAFFNVRHDPAHPLLIRAGGYEIRDVGTRFDLTSDGGLLRVAVEEGRVAIRSPNAAKAVEVGAGQVLTISGTTGPMDVRPARADTIGSWRSGRLVYDDVPLPLVAADISRYVGSQVRIDPVAAQRRFSGVIVPGNRDAMIATLEQLTGLNARTDGNTTRLGDRTGR